MQSESKAMVEYGNVVNHGFMEGLQIGFNKELAVKLIEDIRDKVMRFANNYGCMPNCLLLSKDVLCTLHEQLGLVDWYAGENNSETRIDGFNVQVVLGSYVIKAALIGGVE